MRTLEAADEAAALEVLHAEGCTDGLPVVIPTPERVDRMVLASGLDADADLGPMGPGGGGTTIAKIAANAVMAGCTPDHMPVVVSTLRVLLRPEFDLSEVQSTTHCIAPLLVVNGPLAPVIGLTGGFGALGPGHRANASIGRAIRLCLINIGNAHPGVSDMALLGHPGKFSFCLAEDEAGSPWEPLSVANGYGPEQSTVTLVGTEGPHSVVFVNDADDPGSPDRLLRAIAAVIANPGSNNAHLRGGSVAVALNPEHAQVLADAGLTRADVCRELAERSTIRRSALRALNPAFAGRGDDDDQLPTIEGPGNVCLFVAGGSGLYSAVFPSWAAGAHNNPIVHGVIELDQACEIPGLAFAGATGPTHR